VKSFELSLPKDLSKVIFHSEKATLSIHRTLTLTSPVILRIPRTKQNSYKNATKSLKRCEVQSPTLSSAKINPLTSPLTRILFCSQTYPTTWRVTRCANKLSN